ncbi:unnamed protein product, partial [Candidula unifasciata]
MATKSVDTRMMSDREYDRHLLLHRRRMQTMRPNVDNQPSPHYPHISLGLKRLKTEEQKKAETDRENKLLLKRMTAIMMARSNYPDQDTRKSRSMNGDKRQREQDRITADNRHIAQKIERTMTLICFSYHKERQKLLERLRRSKSKEQSPSRSPLLAKRKQKPVYESDFDSDTENSQGEEDQKDKLPPIKTVGAVRCSS